MESDKCRYDCKNANIYIYIYMQKNLHLDNGKYLGTIISESKECHICHYWHFSYELFNFQPDVWNGYHDLLTMSMNFSKVAILNIKGADYCCIISGIRKSQGINLIQNICLNKKRVSL